MTLKFCPQCGKPLTTKVLSDHERKCCADDDCGFVFWNNPTPVVAAIVEWEGKIVQVRSIGWPEGFYGLVTGFLEQKEHPEAAALREVKEETGLEGKEASFVGIYTFERMNQIIIAYHVVATGDEIQLDTTELDGYRVVAIDDLKPWPSGTGIALRDWLRTKGIEKEFIQWPPRKK